MKRIENGFSLVEMMIALALGLVLFTGVGHLVLASSRSWALQDELARVQENGRLALDILGQSINTAAYTGCPAQAKLANLLYSENDNRQWMMHFDKGVLGIPSGNSVEQQLDSNAISEAIIIHSVDSNQSTLVSGHNTGIASVTLAESRSQDEGDLLALISSDCRQVSIFRAGVETSNRVVTHPAAVSGSLYNCISQLQGNFSCHGSTVDSGNINHQGSRLVPLQSYAFYLRESNNVPVLYRKLAGEYVSGNSINAEALVEGIEGLSIRYGLDSDNDGVANRYMTAGEITPYSDEWRRIITIKLELLARSFTEVAPEAQAYFFAGQRVLPNDLYVRRSFMKTIKLRNRGL
ncbi:PilW family protein [Endozoicomonas sp. SCSIO W0465]|uniref:PilW family protein n=1 Tax=Endozoicomonas sp. SCSIO W0465 TaxID=2918516 RepID=UPI002074B139|nr:PilW family protein [Endozoicomonas sp. SCSIO W0465]USE37528.1 PilW family protein [Endozoicomonas sp. SCSIO W0465]